MFTRYQHKGSFGDTSGKCSKQQTFRVLVFLRHRTCHVHIRKGLCHFIFIPTMQYGFAADRHNLPISSCVFSYFISWARGII